MILQKRLLSQWFLGHKNNVQVLQSGLRSLNPKLGVGAQITI